MNARVLPYGAAEIVALRTGGKRPADMVLVSLIGPLREINPVVIANPSRSYDWRFLVGLSVLVVAKSVTTKADVKRVTDALLALPTHYLGLWLADLQNGMNFIVGGVMARPVGLLRYMTSDDREGFAGIGKPMEVA